MLNSRAAVVVIGQESMAVKNSPCRADVRMSVVIWPSLLIQEMHISGGEPEWKTSMQLGHLSTPPTKHIYFKEH